MKILFYLGHPAHYHLFKNVISVLKKKKHTVFILIKKKDILEELLIKSGLEFLNILPEGRSDSKTGIALGLIKRDLRIFKFAWKNKPDLMLGTSTEITHVGKLLNIPSIVVNEDDHDAVPLFSKLGYPFASQILAPVSCPTGKWEYKSIKYNGYHEFAYLHPNVFKPDENRVINKIDFSKDFYILRFAKLTAHHDEGKSGLSKDLIHKIINLLEPHGKIYITAERELEKEFEKYRIKIDSFDMHHALAFASLYIGDSQTMAAEAAVLGTPSVRFNDFVGKLGYLEELEHKYGLTYGIKTDQPEELLKKIEELLAMSNLKEEWQIKREKMLNETIDVTEFMVDLIENYPASVENVEKL
jgi:uncharacterized protein